MSKLSKDDLSLIKGIVGEVVEEKVKPLQSSIASLEKKVNALSKDNAPKKPNKATENKSTTAKSAKTGSTTESVQRRRISTTKRLESGTFNKVYELAKKYNCRIVHKDENGKALPKDRAHWTFSLEDGKAFADYVDQHMSAIFGAKTKTVPMKSEVYTVTR